MVLFKFTSLVEEALAMHVCWNFFITLGISRTSSGTDFWSIFFYGINDSFLGISFRIKIVPDELLYKTRKFMRIDHAVWASAAAGWSGPPLSNFIWRFSKSSL